MNEYFPKPYEPFGADIIVKLDLYNYATEADLKGATSVHTSNLAAKSALASLKAKVDKKDVERLFLLI